jgi:hypothetical protein
MADVLPYEEEEDNMGFRWRLGQGVAGLLGCFLLIPFFSDIASFLLAAFFFEKKQRGFFQN